MSLNPTSALFTLPSATTRPWTPHEHRLLALASIAVATGVFLVKLQAYLGLGTTDDLYQFAQLATSWLDGRFLHDNHYGNHLAIHSYLLVPALAIFVVPFGAAGLLLATGLAAGASFAVAIVAAVVGLVRSFGNGAADSPTAVGPFGKGPHTVCECRPTRESVADLAGYAQKLREAATDQHWKIDWNKFNALVSAAEAASAAGQFNAGVRQMALALSFMMDEIRHQRPKPPPA